MPSIKNHDMLVNIIDKDHFPSHLGKINDFPKSEKDEEFILINKWLDEQDSVALSKIIQNHLGLIKRVANGYRGFGLPTEDLIAEGKIGLLQALKHFHPSKGFKFSTYAVHWVKSIVRSYIFKHGSALKIGESKDYKKTFFQLRWLKNAFGLNLSEHLNQEGVSRIAKKLNVSEQTVKDIENANSISSHLMSINASSSDGGHENQEWLNLSGENLEITLEEKDDLDYRKKVLSSSLKILNKKEYKIILSRRLSEEPKTLEEISHTMGLSRERVRQIEICAFNKIKKYVLNAYNNQKSPSIGFSRDKLACLLITIPEQFFDFFMK